MVVLTDILVGCEKFMSKLYWNGKLVYDETKDNYIEMLLLFGDKQVTEWSCKVTDLPHVVLSVKGDVDKWILKFIQTKENVEGVNKMKRLTKRENEKYKINDLRERMSNISSIELISIAIQKLGILEDFEEELGIDLITLFKALKKHRIFFINDNDEIEEYIGTLEIIDMCSIKMPFIAVRDLEDYGTTWALTREELEKGE